MLFVGKISKSRGNKGEVVCRISPETDFSHIDFSGEFELKSKKHTKIAKMESYSERGTMLIAKFDISNSINDALMLVGYDVYSREFKSDKFYMNLNGYSVYDVYGFDWGIVSKVDLTGPNKMIEAMDGDDQVMIPFNNSIVLNIDHVKKKILIDPPDGLKDLNK